MTHVMLNREDGSIDFDQRWSDYKTGFGNAGGEIWLGLDNIHQLTSTANYALLVEIEDWNGNQFWAWYSDFSVESEAQLYRLGIFGYDESSTAGDAFTSDAGVNHNINSMLFVEFCHIYVPIVFPLYPFRRRGINLPILPSVFLKKY